MDHLCKEFLGAETNSDATPFDIDLERIKKSNWDEHRNTNKNYGNLIMIIRDRGQFKITDQTNHEITDRSKYELFQTGVLGATHYGIRTGIASTEISFFVGLDSLTNDPKELEKKYYEIARNGFYIPVVDSTGKVLFTPTMYDELRKIFDGVEEFEGNPLEVKRNTPDERYYSEIQKI